MNIFEICKTAGTPLNVLEVKNIENTFLVSKLEAQNSKNEHFMYLSLILLLRRCSVTECFDRMALALSWFFPSVFKIKSQVRLQNEHKSCSQI